MAWEDREDAMTPAIKADHPANSGSYDTYLKAMELVGNRHSKAALVELVNHLLMEVQRASAPINSEEPSEGSES